MGYKSNGTKVRIYDKDGFDINNSKVTYVFNRYNMKEQFKIDSVEYYDANGDSIELSSKEYKVTVNDG